jgi:cysteine desulfurase
MKRIYLDHAATTPVDPQVVDAMLPYFSDIFGNPSSPHSFGREAQRALEDARAKIAAAIGAGPEEIVFTSGGTESDNTAVKGVARAAKGRGGHIITSSIEHHAVLEPCHSLEKEGFDVTRINVDGEGLVDPDDVRRAITDRTILISIMHANNEIGTVQPVEEIGRIAREKGIYFHTDAVQTFGHLNIHVDRLNVDLLSASAHKLYGPKGVGFLYVRKGTRIRPLMEGGDQENGRRASTHNVAGIVGLGKSVEIALARMEDENRRLSALRDRLIREILKMEDVRLNGHPIRRLPNNVNVSISYVEGESLLLNLDMEGIACSTGSACTSSSLEPSHVLKAIGLSHETAHGSLRFSLGRATTEDDIGHVVGVLPSVVEKLRSISPLYRKEAR